VDDKKRAKNGESNNYEFDSPCGEIIEDLFPNFLKIFFPDVYDSVD
jgi:hypothetical protein